MEIEDARGKTIEIGSYIRYTGTGTVGKVVDLRIDEVDKSGNESKWVKLDNPDLWYSNDVVELIDEKDIKSKKNNIPQEKDLDLKDIGNELEDASLTSGGAEGGG